MKNKIYLLNFVLAFLIKSDTFGQSAINYPTANPDSDHNIPAKNIIEFLCNENDI